jgi:hypothetical protein
LPKAHDQNGLLESSLDNIRAQWCPRMFEKSGQLVPAFEEVIDSFAETGVLLNPLLVELGLHPALQSGHHWPAVLLVELQALLVVQTSLAGLIVVTVYPANLLDDVPTLAWKALVDVHKLTAPVRQAIAQYSLEILRELVIA